MASLGVDHCDVLDARVDLQGALQGDQSQGGGGDAGDVFADLGPPLGRVEGPTTGTLGLDDGIGGKSLLGQVGRWRPCRGRSGSWKALMAPAITAGILEDELDGCSVHAAFLVDRAATLAPLTCSSPNRATLVV